VAGGGENVTYPIRENMAGSLSTQKGLNGSWSRSDGKSRLLDPYGVEECGVPTIPRDSSRAFMERRTRLIL